MTENNILKDLESNVLDIEELAYYGEFELASKLLISWKGKAEAAQSENTLKELKACANSLARIGIYVNQMQARQREYNVQLSRFRRHALNEEAKASKAIQELKDYKTEL